MTSYDKAKEEMPNVMWAEDYERLQEQKRKDREAAARAKAEAEAQARLDYEAALPGKSKIEYTDEIAQEICERISSGELLIDICLELSMPTIRRCNQWKKNYPEFNSLYNESIQDRLSIFEEQIIQIADDAIDDFKEVIKNGKAIRVADPEVIARARLRVDVRFKHLKAGKPQKWGDSTTLITKNDGEDPSALSDVDLEKRLKDLDTKGRVFKTV
jgi:hypothetical protein